MFEVVIIETPSLGDRSYLVHDGRVAFVVDPQRDIDRVLAAAAEVSVEITDVFETHIHNDYVTGGLALARACGARYHLNGRDPVGFDRHPLEAGERVVVSASMTVLAVAAPGHTHTHIAYVLEHEGDAVAVFSGGSLLYGSTGRPDLLGPDDTLPLAGAQWETARRLVGAAPDEAALYPTHGFGSFCSATQSDAQASTIGRERHHNPVLLRDREEWIATLVEGLDAWPAYYAQMAPANLAGPAGADLSPLPAVDAAEIARRVAEGEWVVDLRHRKAFCEGHVPGSLNFEVGGSFATYLGWLIPWGTPVTLLSDSADDVATAQRELARIGIDRPAGAATGDPDSWSRPRPPATLRRARFEDLAAAAAEGPLTVVDVRLAGEWEAGHVAGSLNVPLHDLDRRSGEIPGGEVWVHCRSGYRATVAGSVLAAAGRRVVVVDDDLDGSGPAGVTLTRPGG